MHLLAVNEAFSICASKSDVDKRRENHFRPLPGHVAKFIEVIKRKILNDAEGGSRTRTSFRTTDFKFRDRDTKLRLPWQKAKASKWLQSGSGSAAKRSAIGYV